MCELHHTNKLTACSVDLSYSLDNSIHDTVAGLQTSSPSFIAMTANTYSNSPVTYISPKAFKEGASHESQNKPPSHAVDCWSLVLEPTNGYEVVVDAERTTQAEAEMTKSSIGTSWMLASVDC